MTENGEIQGLIKLKLSLKNSTSHVFLQIHYMSVILNIYNLYKNGSQGYIAQAQVTLR